MTNIQTKIAELQSTSLMDLLIDQCSDLEALLALARREVLAAEKSDFRELISVVSERATLGERLEAYHRQIAELRGSMAQRSSASDAVSTQSIRLAVEIQTLDADTTRLLTTTRNDVGRSITRLDDGRRNFTAYLRDGRANGLSCDTRA
jgi:Trp operon repressor